MIIKGSTKYAKGPMKVHFTKYSYSGGTAIQLSDPQTNEPISRPTVADERINLEPEYVLIKDYSENKGIRNLLIQNEIIEERPVGTVRLSLFAAAYIHKLSPKAIQIVERIDYDVRQRKAG